MALLTSTDFRGLFNRRFLNNLFPYPASNRMMMGTIAPAFTLPAVGSDRPISLIDYLQPHCTHQFTLLYFTRIFTEKQYCPLCFPHIVALNAAYDRLVAQRVAVVMITSTDLEQSRIVAQDLGLNMPLLSDPSCQVFRQYQVGQALGAPLPAQFLLDRQGAIRFRHLFSFLEPNASIERLLQAIAPLSSPSHPAYSVHTS